jgi:PKD repeat protein
MALSIDFSADMTLGVTPARVSFTPTVTGGDVTRYLWDFGDGYTSTEKYPVHVYSAYGTHTVAMTVWDVYGDPTRLQKQSYIKLGQVEFSVNTAGKSPVIAQVENQSQAPTGLGFTGWQWDFGDGSTGMGENPTHTYTTPGSYSVSVSVSMTTPA